MATLRYNIVQLQQYMHIQQAFIVSINDGKFSGEGEYIGTQQTVSRKVAGNAQAHKCQKLIGFAVATIKQV